MSTFTNTAKSSNGTFTPVSKATSAYTNTAKGGALTYNDSSITYNQSNITYNSETSNVWTNTNKS